MDAFETRLYSAVLITAVTTGCLIFFFAASLIRSQRKFVRFQRQSFLKEVSLLENERTRIARDLHDELGPLLSLTKLLIGDVTVAQEKGAKQLEKANQNLETILHKLGEISINLTPTGLLKKGLHFALSDFFADIREASPIALRFQYDVISPIQPALGIHLYRIVREAVHNCLKHAEATQVAVSVTEKNKILQIYYQDNGKGFPIQAYMEAATGLGLRSIKSRTEMLGGSLRYQSRPGTGTYYLIHIPFL